ncbi:YcxB family protein [Microbacterium hydrocarbonoxydans]|uniref:YcxB family protein n=1 Tax=Microbacterium hydrocarbonoxydans TaxID=273678 RepID=UPI00203EB1EB|nr:YcxB family protein [Microbacterium hydrocarbonoxydans]MCM3779362.1 YcxB family protein [Microbacterium hydrocarbonoxydans]
MTVTVSESLVRRMARDAAVYGLTRPWAIVMWVALAASLVLSILNLTAGAADDTGSAGWLPLASVALMAVAIGATVSGARRAVRAAMPPGTVVWARLNDDDLQIGADRRVSVIPYETFQGMRVGSDAVILRVQGSSAVTAVPRAVFTDDDVARLRDRIG